ncbi:hypothetical protein G7Z17_g10209 [Cylindrodendrum hubeiense]|uniref:CHAT domain-containing protein n=1 Tax=Cylindrodendrum hubeiense TaxID=595255 RepID=A0A9P5H2J4_9HYPO|nr:hypothetical protein G7Z17_g10209 [Cylindrodendrum hubeiense]
MSNAPVAIWDSIERLNESANEHEGRFMYLGEISYLEVAITELEQALAVAAGYPRRYVLFNNIANKLGLRYDCTKNIEDLERAIDMLQEALSEAPEYHRATLLNNLAVRLDNIYSRTRSISDGEKAVFAAREAVEAMPDEDGNRSIALHNLSRLLAEIYLHTGNIADLEEAIDISRRVLEGSDEDNRNISDYLHNLGVQLSYKYTHTEKIKYLEESISIAQRVLTLTPEGSVERVKGENNLAARLALKSQREGTADGLNEAIELARKAVQNTRENDTNRPGRLSNLSVQLGHRFSRFGAMHDIEEAIEIGEKGVQSGSKDHPDRSVWLSNLGNRFTDKYLRTRNLSDLNNAIQKSRDSLVANLNDPQVLSNLGMQLKYKYQHEKANEDLKEAISMSKRALENVANEHPNRGRWLGNLAVQLGEQYSCTGKMMDLEEAIVAARNNVEAIPSDYPDRAGWLCNLGNRLKDRYSHSKAKADLLEAKHCFDTALDQKQSPIKERVSAGRQLLSIFPILKDCEDGFDWEEAYTAAKTTIDLVPLSAPNSLPNSDKRYVLSQAVGLASDAAAIALYARNEPFTAIELLETGRGIIAGSLQDLRTDRSALEKQHPSLADSFIELRNRLDAPDWQDPMAESSPLVFRRLKADQHRKAIAKLQRLLEAIRSKPGFERFLLPASETEVLKAAAQGPIVIVNVSAIRCDALIIQKSGIKVLELPWLDRQHIINRSHDLRSVQTLTWLWDKLISPVLGGLDLPDPSKDAYPQVWWIPTGPLSKFPLHAAGDHMKRNFKTTIDRVISSYSTSIKTIIHTRQQQGQALLASPELEVLLVAMQHTPEQYQLPHAIEEINTVDALFQPAASSTLLVTVGHIPMIHWKAGYSSKIALKIL